MRKDVKLGLLLSSVVVVAAGWYYVSKDLTEEPLSLDAPVATLQDQADQRVGTQPSEAAGQRESKPSPIRDRTTTAHRPSAKRSTVGRNATGAPATTPERRFADHAGRRAAASPTAARKKPRHDATATNKNSTESTLKASSPKPSDGAKPVKDTFDDLFRFDNMASAAEKPAASPPALGPRLAQAPREGPVRTTGADAKTGPKSTVPQTTARHARASRPPTAKPATKIPAGDRTHTVQRGDSYALLAEYYYGSQRHTRFLIDANPQHPNPRKLREGAVLRIPPLPKQPQESRTETSPKPAAPSAAGARTYVVRAGDSFYRIAAHELGSGARWPELFELNKDVVDGRPERLRVGQTLILPPDKPADTKKKNT